MEKECSVENSVFMLSQLLERQILMNFKSSCDHLLHHLYYYQCIL